MANLVEALDAEASDSAARVGDAAKASAVVARNSRRDQEWKGFMVIVSNTLAFFHQSRPLQGSKQLLHAFEVNAARLVFHKPEQILARARVVTGLHPHHRAAVTLHGRVR